MQHDCLKINLKFSFVLLLSYAYGLSQQTQNICILFVQCWTNVEDVGTTDTTISRAIIKSDSLSRGVDQDLFLSACIVIYDSAPL